jgi:hypothetical protein
MVGGEVEVAMRPHKMKRMMKNHEQGKRYRMELDDEEMQGGSLKSFLSGVKNTAKKLYSQYQRHIKPTAGPKIRSGLKKGIHAGLEIGAATTGDPEAVALANAVATQLEGLVDWLGNKTGAFGMRHRRHHA